MKKKNKRMRNGMVVMTIVAVCSLFIYGQRVKKISSTIDRQIAIENEAIEEKNARLEDLKAQISQVDSPEYIKKVAREELNMVEEDTIVFKGK